MKDTTFQSLLKPITKALIAEGTKRFRSDYDCETFLTWDHLQVMIYAHIHELKSLRTLELAINSQQMLVNKIKKSTLADANIRRTADVFLWILEQLMTLLPRQIRKEIKKVVRLLDSSPFQLKGRGYDEWAKEHRTLRCQGLKLHVEYDLQLKSPIRVKTSHANINDSTMGQRWPIEKETVYVFDKGYYDFNWWWSIHQKQAYFVTRLKKNVVIILENLQEVAGDIILEDSTFKFKNKKPRGGKNNLYTESLRRVVVKREGKKPLVLVTNLRDVSAEIIAELYKARWDIELFFKWIKQNLRIKKFFGKSANAVKIQLATALITYLLVQLLNIILKSGLTLQHALVWVRHNFHIPRGRLKGNDPPVYHFPRQPFVVNREGVYL